MTTIYESLVGLADANPDAIAIFAPGRTPLTYHGLRRHLARVVGMLRSVTIERGGRVALVLPNGPEMLTAFLAVACGAEAAPLNPELSGDEFDAALEDLRVGAVIATAAMQSPLHKCAERRGIPILTVSFSADEPAGTFGLTQQEKALDSLAIPSFAAADDIALLLFTSGTTSRPKRVPATHSALIAGARLTLDALQLTVADRYLCVMPMYHAHALITSLAALLAGGTVIAPPRFDADDFYRCLGEFRPTWYSSAPTIHRAILARSADYRECIAGNSLRFIRSSTASLSPLMLAELEETFRVPVIQGYGMTETCVYATSNPLPPRQRKLGSVGIAAGIEIAVVDERGAPLAAGEPGEITLRGANIMSGYEDDPEANVEAFIDGWFRTGDLGYLDQDGYLYITGRLKEFINRGGEKISPAEVEEPLAKHPDVAAAAVFPVPHPTLGEDLAAAVVLRNDANSSALDLRKYLVTRLAAHKVPTQVVMLDTLPESATGKLPRARLAQLLADRLQEAFVEPRTLDELHLATAWQEVLGLSSISVNDNFFALGGDSLKATQVASRMRQRSRIEIPIQLFFVAPTIAALAQELSAAGAARLGTTTKSVEVRSRDAAPVATTSPVAQPAARQTIGIEFSLFFFSADGSTMQDDKYDLFLQSLRFADENGFHAVWTPERHFHPFGGLYPNPSILGAAAAALTKRIGIRAGSVVVPLQDPLRIAEEWSVIDNLSRGRAGIACASGWHVNDFVLAPENYHERREKMTESIAVIQKLWRGEAVLLPNGAGKLTEVRVYPRPIQQELPIWVTAHGDATFIKAGELGVNVLTALWDTQVKDLARRIQLYRKARSRQGADPQRGTVTLMLHTYLGDTAAMVRQHVTAAYQDYLFTNLGMQDDQMHGLDKERWRGASETRFIVDRATEELFRSRGLVGTSDVCLEKIADLQRIGVDEIACLIDFGIPRDATLRSLERLRDLQLAFNAADS
jgi:natural product biosynthesis luciferase-like monooxygenase protein